MMMMGVLTVSASVSQCVGVVVALLIGVVDDTGRWGWLVVSFVEGGGGGHRRG
jgi:hypothetical protein